jgi:hypothetical protein
MVQVLGNLVEQRGLSIEVVIYTVDAPSPTYHAGKLLKGNDLFKSNADLFVFTPCVDTPL